MGKYRLLVAASLVLASACAYLYAAQDKNASGDRGRPRELYVEGYLQQLGDEYDVYFTLETAWMNGESSNCYHFYLHAFAFVGIGPIKSLFGVAA